VPCNQDILGIQSGCIIVGIRLECINRRLPQHFTVPEIPDQIMPDDMPLSEIAGSIVVAVHTFPCLGVRIDSSTSLVPFNNPVHSLDIDVLPVTPIKDIMVNPDIRIPHPQPASGSGGMVVSGIVLGLVGRDTTPGKIL